MKFDYAEIISSIPICFNQDISITERGDIIVSIGKSACFMYEKYCGEFPEAKEKKALLIVPENISCSDLPVNCTVVFSTHPLMSEKSFIAAQKLFRFINENKPSSVTVLLSGGSSSLIEHSADPEFTIEVNRDLLYSGLDIVSMNKERIKHSLVKGGKFAEMYPGIYFNVFVMSDIPFNGGEYFAGSMPFYKNGLKNCTLQKCADSDTLHDHLIKKIDALRKPGTISVRKFNGSVNELYEVIKKHILQCSSNMIVTGEPSIKIELEKRKGVGGRMSHLALMLLPFIDESTSLYAFSSDGIDGNSFCAGVAIEKGLKEYDGNVYEKALEDFNSANFFMDAGCIVKTGYTGLNLNDFILVIKH